MRATEAPSTTNLKPRSTPPSPAGSSVSSASRGLPPATAPPPTSSSSSSSSSSPPPPDYCSPAAAPLSASLLMTPPPATPSSALTWPVSPPISDPSVCPGVSPWSHSTPLLRSVGEGFEGSVLDYLSFYVPHKIFSFLELWVFVTEIKKKFGYLNAYTQIPAILWLIDWNCETSSFVWGGGEIGYWWVYLLNLDQISVPSHLKSMCMFWLEFYRLCSFHIFPSEFGIDIKMGFLWVNFLVALFGLDSSYMNA